MLDNSSSSFINFTPVAFSLKIRRNGFYHVIIAFIPCLANALLTLLVFLLPPETGERIAVGVNTLLIMWVNYLRVSASQAIIIFNVKFPVQPHQKYSFMQTVSEELGFS